MSRWQQLPVVEKWNVCTHLIGAIASVIGALVLHYFMVDAPLRVNLAVVLYSFSMIFLFSASTRYHAALPSEQALWQRVDHIAIYFLIAGTYTPVGLTVLYDSSGPWLLAIVWTLALVGLLYKLFFIHRWAGFSLFLYLAMGWLVVFQVRNVQLLFSPTAFLYLVLGGVFYTTGVLFYRWHQLKYHHVIWHFFVLFGAFFHFLMVVAILQQQGYLDL